MEDLETKARELLDKLYADIDVDRNFESFCALLHPIIRQRAKHFINIMEGYDEDDLFQEAYIVIWRIALIKKPVIQSSVLGYFSRSIWYGFIDLFYQYALTNYQRIYAGTDFGAPSLSYYRLREIDYVERRKKKARERARERYIEKYIEKHGYPPDQAPPKPVLSEKERKAREIEYNAKNRGKRHFLFHERDRIDRSGVIRAFRLSARPGDPEKNEPKYVLTEGRRGGLPLGAQLSEDEYRQYMELKYPRFSTDIALEAPQSFEEMLAIAERNGILFGTTRKKYQKRSSSEIYAEAETVEPGRTGRLKQWKDRKEYYRANKARIKAQRHIYYVANRERIIAASKEYYYSHREEISAINKEYYDAYHDYVLLKDKRRREEEAYIRWRDEKREKLTTAKKPESNARQRMWLRAYRETHSREEELAKAHDHYMEHREEITAKLRAERQENHDEVLAKQRAYHHKHRKRINAQRRDYYQEHKEKFKEWNRQYYAEHTEEHREWSRQYRATHVEECRERSLKYYEEHKDELNQKRRQKRAEENELSKTDPEVAAKREERLAKQREYNRRYREKKRAEKAEAKAQTESGI